MRKRNFLIYSVLLCLLISGCNSETISEQKYTDTVFAMDTVMDFTIYASADGEAVLQEAQQEVERLDGLLDRGNMDSEVYRINREKTTEISKEVASVLETALSISKETAGAFDPTIAPVVDLWGFYGHDYRVPSDAELQTAIEHVGYQNVLLEDHHISIPIDTSIDLGGIGKGYASDKIIELFKKNDIKSALISLGGNVHTIGNKPDGTPWIIGIADPKEPSQHIGTLQITGKAVVTSGGYQQCFEQDGTIWHHIIDPKTGKSSDSGLLSVTIIADEGTRADGLSTALFVMGLEQSIEFWRSAHDFEAVFVDAEGKIYVTAGISDAFQSDSEVLVIQ